MTIFKMLALEQSAGGDLLAPGGGGHPTDQTLLGYGPGEGVKTSKILMYPETWPNKAKT